MLDHSWWETPSGSFQRDRTSDVGRVIVIVITTLKGMQQQHLEQHRYSMHAGLCLCNK